MKLALDGSRLTSDDGGVTSSDCETRPTRRSKSDVVRGRALRQRRTVDVVDADLIAYRPVNELRPPAGRGLAETAPAAVKVRSYNGGYDCEHGLT